MTLPVSVIVPVFNGAAWIDEALASLETQSQPVDEILVVDDGGTDESMSIVAARNLPNLRIIKGPGQGLSRALQAGVDAARNDLIGRLDQDDLAHPQRFQVQAAYLANSPELAMCGTWARVARPGRPTRMFRPPTTADGIRRYMCLGNPFVHSSVMFRRAAVMSVGGYWAPDSTTYPEDFNLWSRLVRKHRLGIIGRPLVTYRARPGSMSQAGRSQVGVAAVAIAAANFEHLLGSAPSPEETAVMRAFHHVADPAEALTVRQVRAFLLRVRGGSAARVFPVSTRARLLAAAMRPGSGSPGVTHDRE